MDFSFLKQYKELIGNTYNTYFSPGRINLIGEHIDYLGGNVFPTAISLGTYAVVSKREDNELYFTSHNFQEQGTIIVSLNDLSYKKEDNWANYAKGMFKKYIDKGHTITHGLNILINGTLPNSSGLSSSASLEVLVGTIIREEYKIKISNIEIVLDSKDVENNYVGVNCGIMDQFAIGMSEKNKAIYLNTETLEYRQIPLELKEYALLIANTNKKRALADSYYNQRVNECKEAKEIINNNGFNIQELCELKYKDLDQTETFLSGVLLQRVRHAITENHRTKKAVQNLIDGDLLSFGALLYESHRSLKNDYEVSCVELDTLVNSFRRNGAIGSRMTGAGFGGCAIALVPKKDIKKIIEKVEKDYKKIIGYETNIYKVEPSGGPQICERGAK